MFLNQRLNFFCRVGSKCPYCGDREQQQVLDYLSPKPSWRCRMCRFCYVYEPPGTPPLDTLLND